MEQMEEPKELPSELPGTLRGGQVQKVVYTAWDQPIRPVPQQYSKELDVARILRRALERRSGRAHSRKGVQAMLNTRVARQFAVDAYWWFYVRYFAELDHDHAIRVYIQSEVNKENARAQGEVPRDRDDAGDEKCEVPQESVGVPSLPPLVPVPRHLSPDIEDYDITPRKGGSHPPCDRCAVHDPLDEGVRLVELDRLFGDLSKHYQLLFYNIPTRQKDLMMKDFPDIMASALHEMLTRTMPYGWVWLKGDFKAVLLRTLSFWTSGVERDIKVSSAVEHEKLIFQMKISKSPRTNPRVRKLKIEDIQCMGSITSLPPLPPDKVTAALATNRSEGGGWAKEDRPDGDSANLSPDGEGVYSATKQIAKVVKLGLKGVGSVVGATTAFNTILDAQGDELRQDLQDMRKEFQQIAAKEHSPPKPRRPHAEEALQPSSETDARAQHEGALPSIPHPPEAKTPKPPNGKKAGYTRMIKHLKPRGEQVWYEKGKREGQQNTQWTKGDFFLCSTSPLMQR
eukprot:Sspe_Gene.26305::Locus_10836_Transcript_1_1_Confidence_1.000_Length_2634::g.26305::m.26305